MNVTYFVQFKTGYNLTDNEIARLQELIDDALQPLNTEFHADITVTTNYILPGLVLEEEGQDEHRSNQ